MQLQFRRHVFPPLLLLPMLAGPSLEEGGLLWEKSTCPITHMHTHTVSGAPAWRVLRGWGEL